MMETFRKLILITALLTAVLLTGCATAQEFWGRLTGKAEETVVTSDSDGDSIRYSQNPQMTVPSNRQYKRMTRSRMEDESDLGAQAGSTWVMEGQSSYLFAQNKARREGDVLNIKLDGPSLKQIQTKVSVIKKLLKQLDEQNSGGAIAGAERGPAGEGAAATAAAKPEAAKEDKDELTDIQQITTKIVERMPDGNFRIRGAQPFMIGKREYKVIAAGLVRPEDFNDEGIVSTKLVDPQFDVVSIRRNPKSE